MADTLTITDNRTGKQYEIPITDGTIRAIDLRQIKVDADDFGLMTYDPAFMNTASCRSTITFIDGDKGILRYRGYPIEQLAEHSDLSRDGLPDPATASCRPRHSSTRGRATITHHTMLHENIKKFMEGFQLRRPPDGHVPQHGRRALDVLPGRARTSSTPESRKLQIDPAHRQGADASPPTRTATASACPTSTRTTT